MRVTIVWYMIVPGRIVCYVFIFRCQLVIKNVLRYRRTCRERLVNLLGWWIDLYKMRLCLATVPYIFQSNQVLPSQTRKRPVELLQCTRHLFRISGFIWQPHLVCNTFCQRHWKVVEAAFPDAQNPHFLIFIDKNDSINKVLNCREISIPKPSDSLKTEILL